jgi:hypothetical protein
MMLKGSSIMDIYVLFTVKTGGETGYSVPFHGPILIGINRKNAPNSRSTFIYRQNTLFIYIYVLTGCAL